MNCSWWPRSCRYLLDTCMPAIWMMMSAIWLIVNGGEPPSMAEIGWRIASLGGGRRRNHRCSRKCGSVGRFPKSRCPGMRLILRALFCDRVPQARVPCHLPTEKMGRRRWGGGRFGFLDYGRRRTESRDILLVVAPPSQFVVVRENLSRCLMR